MVFLANAINVFTQVLILAIIVVIGFLGDRRGFFTEKTARGCNDLLFYIITPALIINSFSTIEFTKENASGFLTECLCCAVFHVLAIAVSLFVFNKGERDKNVVFKYATVYANMGYMGIPLSQAVMETVTGNGEIGVFYCSAAMVVFNIFSFTHGVTLMSNSGEKLSVKKLFLNPGVIGILIGAPIFLLGINLPEIIKIPLTHVGNMNTPLAMILFGTYLSKSDFKSMFKQGNIYITAILKLVVLPLVAIFGFYLFGVRGNLLIVASVFVSAPTATNTSMFAAKFGKDTTLASQVTGLVSILAIITMPLCVALAMLLA